METALLTFKFIITQVTDYFYKFVKLYTTERERERD